MPDCLNDLVFDFSFDSDLGAGIFYIYLSTIDLEELSPLHYLTNAGIFH